MDGALTRLEDDILSGPNPWLRNSNDVARYDESKAGPRSILKVAAGDWRMWWECIKNTDAGNDDLTQTAYASSVNGVEWVKDDAANPVFVPNALATPENDEAAPSSVVWNPATGKYHLYYHGGNNGGTRRIYLATSTDGATGKAWTRENSGNPIISLETGDVWHADAKVIRVSATSWVMFYRRNSAVNDTIYRATSTDGVTWVVDTVNSPVINVGAATTWDDARVVATTVPIVDLNGRWHLWYVGNDGSFDAVGYAHSDNLGVTWTKGGSNPVLTRNGEVDSPDAGGAGDVLDAVNDGEKIIVTYGADTLAGYTGAGGVPIRCICAAWLPYVADVVPAVPGRFFVGTDRVSMANTVDTLDQTAFTIAARVRTYEHNTFREIYTEEAAFNESCYLRVTSAGVVNGFYRTPTAQVDISGAARLDDNLWHNVAWRRNGAGSFDLIVDGAVVVSSSTNPGTTSVAPFIAYGNWHASAAPGATEPFLGCISRIAVWRGAAITLAEITAFLDNGTLPAAGAPSWWHDPGTASPETDLSGNGNTGTVTGTTRVNAAPTFGLVSLASDRRETPDDRWWWHGGL